MDPPTTENGHSIDYEYISLNLQGPGEHHKFTAWQDHIMTRGTGAGTRRPVLWIQKH